MQVMMNFPLPFMCSKSWILLLVPQNIMSNLKALLTPPVYESFVSLYGIKTLATMTASKLHACPPIQDHPLLQSPLTKKAIRKALCLKIMLCARVDMQDPNTDGQYGRQYYKHLEPVSYTHLTLPTTPYV